MAAKQRREDPARVTFDTVISEHGLSLVLTGYTDKRCVVGRYFKIGVVVVRLVFCAGVYRVDDDNAIPVKKLTRHRISRKQSVIKSLNPLCEFSQHLWIDLYQAPFAVGAQRIDRSRSTKDLSFLSSLRQAIQEII